MIVADWSGMVAPSVLLEGGNEHGGKVDLVAAGTAVVDPVKDAFHFGLAEIVAMKVAVDAVLSTRLANPGGEATAAFAWGQGGVMEAADAQAAGLATITFELLKMFDGGSELALFFIEAGIYLLLAAGIAVALEGSKVTTTGPKEAHVSNNGCILFHCDGALGDGFLEFLFGTGPPIVVIAFDHYLMSRALRQPGEVITGLGGFFSPGKVTWGKDDIVFAHQAIPGFGHAEVMVPPVFTKDVHGFVTAQGQVKIGEGPYIHLRYAGGQQGEASLVLRAVAVRLKAHLG